MTDPARWAVSILAFKRTILELPRAIIRARCLSGAAAPIRTRSALSATATRATVMTHIHLVVNHVATPPWAEQVPRVWWLRLYAPSEHSAVAPKGR